MNDDRINEVFYGQASDARTQALARERISWLCSQVRGEGVLDVGCSQGIASILMAREGRQVVAVDRETAAIAYAAEERRREPAPVRDRIRLLHAEGAALPLSAATFDTVVLGEVIEHLEEPSAVIAEVARVVKPGGRVVLTTPFGYLSHSDHRRTFYVTSLLATLSPYFSTLALDVQEDAFLRYVGIAGPAETELNLEALMLAAEDRLAAKEQRYVERITTLRGELREAAEKYRRATERNEILIAAVRAPRDASATPAQESERDHRLADALADAYRETDDLRHRLADALSEDARLETEIESLRAENASLQTESESLQAELAKRDAIRRKLEERLQTARARSDGLARRGAQLDRQVKQLAFRLRVYDRSRAGRVIRLYWRVMGELVRGDRGQRKAFLRSAIAWLRRRLGGTARTKRRSVGSLERFLASTRASRAPAIVFMFSGTTFIQEHRGNRPIRLSRLLRERGIPVLFSYWRWKKSEAIPADEDEALLQLPIDLVAEEMNRIAASDLGNRRKIFVVTFPHLICARFLHAFTTHGWQTIYDVRDDWEEFHQVGAAKWYSEAIERYIANNVDVVTAVSSPLREKIQGYLDTGTVALSPNALDTRFLGRRRLQVRPRDGRQVIGYVGHLTAAWFDWEALVHVARTRPDWTLEIVGHSAPADLDLPPNLRLLGPRDYRQILDIARGWRAALIPFKICRLSDGVDPIKVYEYLAMGLPVVSFRMPQIHDYPYVFIAHDREQFVARIEEALAAEMDPGVIRRFLAVNRWQDRVDQLLSWPFDPRLEAIRSLARGPR